MAAKVGEFGVPDEEVLCTLDVVVHHEFDGRLHQLIHPLRPEFRPPDVPTTVRLRPARNVMQLEYEIPAVHQHFDSRAAEDPKMRRMRHIGSEAPMKSLHYAGVVSDGALHLHGLQSLQMVRPDMSYLDISESEPPRPALSSEPTKVTAHFKRTDERTLAARRSSFAHLKEAEEADTWTSLAAYGSDTTRGHDLLSRMVSHDIDEAEYDAMEAAATAAMAPAFGARAPVTYLRSLAANKPDTTSTDMVDHASPSAPSKGPGMPLYPISMHDLRQRPIAVQIEEMLRRTSLLPLSRLLELVKGGSAKEIFEMTNKIGRSVRGNIVIKSELLFKPHWSVRLAIVQHQMAAAKTSTGAVAQSSAAAQLTAAKSLLQQYSYKPQTYAILCAYRDYILGRFCESASISGNECMEITGMPKPTFLAIIKPLADPDPEVKEIWHFKLLDDTNYQAALPSEATKERKHWARRISELESFFASRGSAEAPTAPPADSGHKDVPDDHETALLIMKTAPAVTANKAGESNTAEAPTASTAPAADRGEAGAAKQLSEPLEVPTPEAQGSVLATKLTPGQRKALHYWVTSTLSKHGVLSMQSFSALFMKERASHKDLSAVASTIGVADAEEMSVVPELNALLSVPLVDAAAYLPDRQVFLTLSQGPLVDRYRTPIVRYLSANKNVKKKGIEEMLAKVLGEVVPDASVTKVLKEIAVSSGSVWNLKTGEISRSPSSLTAAAEDVFATLH